MAPRAASRRGGEPCPNAAGRSNGKGAARARQCMGSVAGETQGHQPPFPRASTLTRCKCSVSQGKHLCWAEADGLPRPAALPPTAHPVL